MSLVGVFEGTRKIASTNVALYTPYLAPTASFSFSQTNDGKVEMIGSPNDYVTVV